MTFDDIAIVRLSYLLCVDDPEIVQPLEKALLLLRPLLDKVLVEVDAGELSPAAFGTAKEDLKLVELVHANFIWRRRAA